MFAPRYFAPRYYPPRYFPVGGEAPPPPPTGRPPVIVVRRNEPREPVEMEAGGPVEVIDWQAEIDRDDAEIMELVRAFLETKSRR